MLLDVFTMVLGGPVPMACFPSDAVVHGMSAIESIALLTYLIVGSLLGRCSPGYIDDRTGRFNTAIVTLVVSIAFIPSL